MVCRDADEVREFGRPSAYCASLLGESPNLVGVGAPGSGVAASGEILGVEADRRKPLPVTKFSVVAVVALGALAVGACSSNDDRRRDAQIEAGPADRGLGGERDALSPPDALAGRNDRGVRDGGERDGGSGEPGPWCRSAWCWERPLPGGDTLTGVWVGPAGRIFAVGTGGTVLRGEAGEWHREESGTIERLEAVWGTGDTAFAVGATGTILRRQAGKWEAMLSGTNRRLRAVWGFAPDDVVAVGEYGTLLHYRGNYWAQVPSGATNTHFSGVWGPRAEEVLIVGSNGALLGFDGKVATTKDPLPFATSDDDAYAIWGSAADNIYVSGSNGQLLRFDGADWTSVDCGAGARTISAIGGSAATDVFVVGASHFSAHFDGSRWSEVSSALSMPARAVASLDSGKAIAVGDGGSAFVFEAGWRQILPSEGVEGVTIRAFWGEPGGRPVVAVGSSGTVLRWRQDGWIKETGGGWESTDLRDVWGVSLGDFFVVGGYATLLHFSGANVFREDLADLVPNKANLFAIWGRSATEVVVVGAEGTILHYDGVRWTRAQNASTETLLDVWGTPPGTLAGSARFFAVGDNGTILRYEGTGWKQEAGVPTTKRISAIWGSAHDRVYAAAEDAMLLFDGQVWRRLLFEHQGYFYSLWGQGPDEVWAGAAAGRLYRFNAGRGWQRVLTGAENAITAIWGGGAEIFSGGDDSAILRGAR